MTGGCGRAMVHCSARHHPTFVACHRVARALILHCTLPALYPQSSFPRHPQLCAIGAACAAGTHGKTRQEAEDRRHSREQGLPLADRRPAGSGFPFLRRSASCRSSLLRVSLANGISAGKAAPSASHDRSTRPSSRLDRRQASRLSVRGMCKGSGASQLMADARVSRASHARECANQRRPAQQTG